MSRSSSTASARAASCSPARGEYASDQLADAYAAFDHLTSLPFVNADRIGVVGLSMGGSTALRVAATAHGRAKTDYAAAVAYYPYGFDYLYSFDVPVMILIGADDDWTPARLCSAVASRDPDHVDLTIYPDTHHSFDLPMGGPYVIEVPPGEFHTVGREPHRAAGLAGAHAKALRGASRPGALRPCRRRAFARPTPVTTG